MSILMVFQFAHELILIFTAKVVIVAYFQNAAEKEIHKFTPFMSRASNFKLPSGI